MSTLQAKLATARAELNSQMIARDREIDLALVALVAGLNYLMIGPPGCGKSMLADAILKMVGARKFSVLIGKTTPPEDLIGPIDICAVQEGRWKHITENFLPEADVAFLDEVFKGSASVLNVMLKILNERLFFDDKRWHKVPLIMAIAASNEYPPHESLKDLSAFFDRFIIRSEVVPISSPSDESRLYWGDFSSVKTSVTFSADELSEARAAAAALPWEDATKETYETICRDLRKEGVVPSDRRRVQAVRVCRARAYVDGSLSVTTEHLDVLCHCLWDDPSQIDVTRSTVMRVAAPAGMLIAQLVREAQEAFDANDNKDPAKLAETGKKLKMIVDKLLGHAKSPRGAVALKKVNGLIVELRRRALDSVSI